MFFAACQQILAHYMQNFDFGGTELVVDVDTIECKPPKKQIKGYPNLGK